MGDTAVAITAGSGTQIDTRTEATNSNHRQVVVIGDPSINAGVAPVDVTAGLSVNVTNASVVVTGTVAVTGVATAAKQPALGTAGTPSADVITVQGAALGTALPTSRAVVSALHFVAAGTTNTANVKASAGTFRGFDIFNRSDTPIYLKLHNTAGTPTAGASVVRTYGIQAGVWCHVEVPGGGLTFGTGIGMSLVGGIADNDTTALTASDAVGEIYFD